ncbi:hypothetical protein AG0111_0g8572 [Alternaria gaisen]|uniref:Uncharacterized protein n=1 Tax=Alternaria gaisen TaxID=167740 RepID=A0ACB6FFW1_9PLEO|nr:hypothetical protein AG0111_0g8572 [Alternaria gaisen]
MYKTLSAVLLISTRVWFTRGYNISPASYLLLNAGHLAGQRLNWQTPLSTKDDWSIVLDFDGISTTDGQAAIELYNGLLFEGLTVVNVTDSSLLDDEDRDCATSHTNTLISFSHPEGQTPQIKIGAAQLDDEMSSPMFDLLSLSIKPRQKQSSDPVLIRYKFWQIQNGKTETAYLDLVFHGVGHHTVAHVDFERYGYTIRNLTAFEINVMENSKLDFAFCLDDLGVRIHNTTGAKETQ